MCTRPRPYSRDNETQLLEHTELRVESCRGGRAHRVLVNRRTRLAITLDAAEANAYEAVHRGSAGPAAVWLFAALRERGFFAETTPASRRVRVRTALATLDLRFAGGHHLVEFVYRYGGRYLFRPAAVVLQAFLALAGTVAVAHVFADASLHLRLTPAQVPIALAIALVAIGLHECAHALVVVHHGRRVDAVGVRLHLGVPAFYVESVEALLLTRQQRLVQAFAGSWAEWLVTSMVALWVSADASTLGLAVVARFVMLNTFTIASNLLPFTGLDGQLILADLIGEPDLGPASRGAAGDLVTALLTGRPVSRRQRGLAAYAVLNGLVAVALLGTAVLFWYAMFGHLLATMWSLGPVGVALVVAVLAVVLQPAARAGCARSAAALRTAAELAGRVRFRAQWRWRIAATHAFAAALPELLGADDHVLGLTAGRLRRVGTRTAVGATPHCHVARLRLHHTVVHTATCRRRGRIVLPSTPLIGSTP